MAKRFKVHWEVLTKEQKELLPKLKFLKEKGFYLAGGTALALQIGHRTSIDFDFYNRSEFDSEIFFKEMSAIFPNIKQLQLAENTLKVMIGRTELSFFYYPYDLIRPKVAIDVDLASKEDIAAMKLLAIASRGARRDFIDLYFLIQEFGIERIFDFLKEKYPHSNAYHALVGLTYFEDADKDVRTKRFKLLKEAPSWKSMKKYFIKLADDLRKSYFKI